MSGSDGKKNKSAQANRRVVFFPKDRLDSVTPESNLSPGLEGLSGRIIQGYLILDEEDPFIRKLSEAEFEDAMVLLLPDDTTSESDSFFRGKEVGDKPSSFPSDDAESLLSNREMDVLRLVVAGLRRSEVARELSISVHTYDTHRKNIRKKLGVSSLGEMIQEAHRRGLL